MFENIRRKFKKYGDPERRSEVQERQEVTVKSFELRPRQTHSRHPPHFRDGFEFLGYATVAVPGKHIKKIWNPDSDGILSILADGMLHVSLTVRRIKGEIHLDVPAHRVPGSEVSGPIVFYQNAFGFTPEGRRIVTEAVRREVDGGNAEGETE